MPVDVYAISMKVNLIFVVVFPFLFGIIVFAGMVLSNRFAGPLKRVEKELNEIAASQDFEKRISVRKNDDIGPL
jgi:methyl-accepting chemotaxis protein